MPMNLQRHVGRDARKGWVCMELSLSFRWCGRRGVQVLTGQSQEYSDYVSMSLCVMVYVHRKLFLGMLGLCPAMHVAGWIWQSHGIGCVCVCCLTIQ